MKCKNRYSFEMSSSIFFNQIILVHPQIQQKLMIFMYLSQLFCIIFMQFLQKISMQLTNQQIIQLITTTYSSPNTSEIDQAFAILIKYAFEVYPKSFPQLEQILVGQEYQIDNNCKKAIINLVKVSGAHILDTLSVLNRSEDDVVTKHKKLLHAVEHILENKLIESSLKGPIVELYVDLFIFFSPQNYQRLISKAKFHYNTKEYFLALSLTQTFIHRKIALKYKFPYCEQTLELMISEFSKKVQSIIEVEKSLEGNNSQVITKFFDVLVDLWNQMTFEKFETTYDRIFTSQTFFILLQSFDHPIFGNYWKKDLHSIISKIVVSLGRCSLFNKYHNTTLIIQNMVSRQFQILLNGGESNVETLTLIAAAIQYKLLQFRLSASDLFTKLIYPNYLLIEKYLESQAENLREAISVLDDASFYMESEMIQVIRHKIVYLLCKNFQPIGGSFRSLIYSFFCQHILTLGKGQIREMGLSVSLSQGIDVWNMVKQRIRADQLIEIVLLYSALSANFFISEMEFMKAIEEFVIQNENYLLLNPNKKIVFYSLLIYKNYMDDIFSSASSGGLRETVVTFAINNNTDPFIKSFAIDIIKQKLSQHPSYDQFSKEISMILIKMTEEYRHELIPLVIAIFKEYGAFIESQAPISITKTTLSIWQNMEIHYNTKSDHLQLLMMFMNIQSCSQYYQFLIGELIKVANQNVRSMQNHIEEFLELIVKGLEVCKRLPSSFEPTIVKFQVIVNSIPMMELINKLIMYSTQGIFFNWLALMLTRNHLNIYQILLIHNLIFYGSKILDSNSIRMIISSSYLERIVKKSHFDYRNGKINLNILLLLKYHWKQTNDLLLNNDWGHLIANGQNLTTYINRFGKDEEIRSRPFIDEIYDLLYKEENIYRWKYDIELFLVTQLDIFKYRLQDQFQFAYANLSFIACTMNILRAYDFIENHFIEEGSDSDESLHPHSKIEREYREVQEIIDRFVLPPHLKEADYFTTYRQIICNLKKDKNSNEWLDLLFKAAFKQEHYLAFKEVIKIEKNAEGNYRQIKRIRRKREEDDSG